MEKACSYCGRFSFGAEADCPQCGTSLEELFCDRCGILIAEGTFCTAEDRKYLKDDVTPCVIAMTPDEKGKVACWCTSFPSRQFKHTRKLSKEEMDLTVKHCPCCEGTGRCNGD